MLRRFLYGKTCALAVTASVLAASHHQPDGQLRTRPNQAIATSFAKIEVDPSRVSLSGPNCRYSLLVTGQTLDGQLVDLTRAANYWSVKPDIAEIGPDAVAQSVTDGQTHIEVAVAGRTISVPVVVIGAHQPRAPQF